ncbi:MAG: carbohydrate ABC transporter permease [Chloroflexi bacterium]|nr:carbohydrate ABC transporter permease [Chloroflexota bacterium]
MATTTTVVRAAPRRLPRRQAVEATRRALTHLLLIVFCASCLVPFWWMVASSFKQDFETFMFPPTWIPLWPTLENYDKVFNSIPFWTFVVNSAKITTLAVGGELFTVSLAAFAFARLQFKGRDAIFMLLLATMMVPGAVTIVPLFVLMHQIGWINTHLPLIIPPMLGSAYGTFLLRQFMLSLPTELEDAARIDGCSSFGVYWRVSLPLMKPALATLGVFAFMGQWNSFFGPLIFLDKVELFTIQLGLALLRGRYYTSWSLLMAGSVLATIPIVVLFVFLQRYFVQGIALTGIKG